MPLSRVSVLCSLYRFSCRSAPLRGPFAYGCQTKPLASYILLCSLCPPLPTPMEVGISAPHTLRHTSCYVWQSALAQRLRVFVGRRPQPPTRENNHIGYVAAQLSLHACTPGQLRLSHPCYPQRAAPPLVTVVEASLVGVRAL